MLSSCASTADRLFVDLWTNQAPPTPDVAELLKPLVEIVGARNRPEEIGRVLDVLAGQVRLGTCDARPAGPVLGPRRAAFGRTDSDRSEVGAGLGLQWSRARSSVPGP